MSRRDPFLKLLVLLVLCLVDRGCFAIDFVGFSYSRADVTRPSSRRFVSFLNENLNINANFLPRYASFEATRPGVYSFNFAFLSPRSETTVLALRKNGETLVTALSESGGLNPVSQAALTFLKEGDVVQLEIIQGRLDEGSERAYTSFSGWLIGPTFDQRSDCGCNPGFPDVVGPPAPPLPPAPPVPPTHKPSYLPPATARPPYNPTPRPPYNPTPRPPYNPTPKPPYFQTTTQPPFIITPEVIEGRNEECCDSILLSSSSPDSPALINQDEKFGVYRLQYVDRTASGKGRGTYKHIDRDLFLFYDGQSSGWIVGPRPGVSLGGLFQRSRSVCVEHVEAGGDGQWQYFYDDTFIFDGSVSVSCFVKGYLDGRTNNVVVDGKTHYHHHRHVHFHHQKPRALDLDLVDHQNEAPSYRLRGNNQFVEATFLIPQPQSNNTRVSDAKKNGFLVNNLD